MRTVESYRRLLHNLLPFGKAWLRDNDGNLSSLLRGLSEELFRVELSARDLEREAFPDESTIPFLLTDYERLLGLPDECTPVLPATELERQQLVKSRLTARGGQTEQYFIDLGISLGYDTVTVTATGEPTTCQMECDDPLVPGTEVFVWLVELEGPGDLETAECLIKAFAPAHTFPIVTEVES